MSIRLMICYARSGGTILNQCLGSLPGVVILSEVNPLGGGAGRGPVSYKSIKSQAAAWYGIELRSDESDFAGCAVELERACEATGRQLVLRDWPWANFMPVDENGGRPPSRLLILEALEDRARVVPFAFVRDGIDVYLSCRKFSTDSGGRVEAFAEAYLEYVRAIRAARLPVFKFEDFTADPAGVLRGICRATGLPFHPDFRGFHRFDKVNGDVQFGKLSRGARRPEIQPLPRRRISREDAWTINRCLALGEANALLDYPPFYESRNRDSRIARGLDEMRHRAAALAEAVRKAAAKITGI